MTLLLRPYQLELIDAVWQELFKEDSALAQLPTGGGKTLCFAHLLKKSLETKPDIRVTILMGRVDLVLQTERALTKVLPMRDVGVFCGTLNRRERNRPITVASIQSIVDAVIVTPNLIIIDEAHNLDQDNGRYISFIDKHRNANPKLKLVGFTATPFRCDGYIYGEKKLFKRLAFQRTIGDMISLGFLCRPILKQVESAFDTSDLRIRAGEYMQEDIDKLVSDEAMLEQQVAEALKKMEGRKCIAWATANIAHCERVMLALIKSGENTVCIHSKQDRNDRDYTLTSFRAGRHRHMVFVSILSEGFDHPPIDCIVFMRPTRSPVLYVQTVGRGLRPFEGKDNCLVLDYGQVVRELGPLDDPKIKGVREEEGRPVLKCCPQCHSWVAGGCKNCPDCSFEFEDREPPEKKLTKRADDNAKILSDEMKPETEEVGPVYINMHKAKSGNDCVKITYAYGGMLNHWHDRDGVSEFFVVTSPWAMQRLEQRLALVGGELPKIPFDGEIRVEGTFRVTKIRDGKYWRVLSVQKISEESPAEAEQDLSFNFGANAEKTEVGW